MRRGSIDLKVGTAILGGGFGYEINDGVMDVEMIAGNKTWLLPGLCTDSAFQARVPLG